MATGDGFLLLTGFMGAGKSTVAPLVARLLRRPVRDLDAEIERAAGLSLVALWAREGELGVRALERRVLQRLLAGPPAVIATGGGTWCDAVNRARLQRAGRVVCLTGDPRILWRRVQAGAGRPLAQNYQSFAALWEERAPWYRRIAWQIDTGTLPPEAVARAVAALFSCTST